MEICAGLRGIGTRQREGRHRGTGMIERVVCHKREKGKNMKKAHFLSNADTAMNFLRSKQVKITTTTTKKKRNTQK